MTDTGLLLNRCKAFLEVVALRTEKSSFSRTWVRSQSWLWLSSRQRINGVERDIESGDMTVPERQNLRPSFARNRRVAQRRDAERLKKYYHSFLGGGQIRRPRWGQIRIWKPMSLCKAPIKVQ